MPDPDIRTMWWMGHPNIQPTEIRSAYPSTTETAWFTLVVGVDIEEHETVFVRDDHGFYKHLWSLRLAILNSTDLYFTAAHGKDFDCEITSALYNPEVEGATKLDFGDDEKVGVAVEKLETFIAYCTQQWNSSVAFLEYMEEVNASVAVYRAIEDMTDKDNERLNDAMKAARKLVDYLVKNAEYHQWTANRPQISDDDYYEDDDYRLSDPEDGDPEKVDGSVDGPVSEMVPPGGWVTDDFRTLMLGSGAPSHRPQLASRARTKPRLPEASFIKQHLVHYYYGRPSRHQSRLAPPKAVRIRQNDKKSPPTLPQYRRPHRGPLLPSQHRSYSRRRRQHSALVSFSLHTSQRK